MFLDTSRFVSKCLLSKPRSQRLNGLLTMLKYHHILDTQQCKTIMTLSDHEGTQIIRDTIPKSFLRDFRAMPVPEIQLGAF
jgi:hypothetical protein